MCLDLVENMWAEGSSLKWLDRVGCDDCKIKRHPYCYRLIWEVVFLCEILVHHMFSITFIVRFHSTYFCIQSAIAVSCLSGYVPELPDTQLKGLGKRSGRVSPSIVGSRGCLKLHQWFSGSMLVFSGVYVYQLRFGWMFVWWMGNEAPTVDGHLAEPPRSTWTPSLDQSSERRSTVFHQSKGERIHNKADPMWLHD